MNGGYRMQKLTAYLVALLFMLTAVTPESVSRAAALLTLWKSAAIPQSANDNSLATARQSDRAVRDADGKLKRLSPGEHVRRAKLYLSNRAFAEAREHWEALIKYYPQDENIPAALFGIGRSYFQERRYGEAFSYYDRVARQYPQTKDGREGLNFSAAALLRMDRPFESVERYREYIEKYPTGERVESAHLNLIDTLREAGRPQEAIQWVARTREGFAGTPTETNAMFARLRLDIAESNWKHAISTADELSAKRFQKEVLTSPA